MSKQKPRGLGRGLSALMADIDIPESEAQFVAGHAGALIVPIEQISPNPDQPRRSFNPDALRELADSLRARGVIQPLIVREHPDDPGLYQIVAGERRWRAAQLAQLHDLPVIVREFSDVEMMEVAIIENIQRADLNAIEEASSYRQLMDKFGHTQEKMSEALGKSRSHIANLLRLLNLPDQVQEWVKSEQLSAGHARALITADHPTALARKVIEKGLSVRETERLVQGAGKGAARTRRGEPVDADTRALASDLSAHLRMSVQIRHIGHDGGKMTITYRNLDQLDRLCRALSADD